MPDILLQPAPAWLRARGPARTRRPTFAVCTLGCKVNQADTHAIARLLEAAGLEAVPFSHGADAYVIDTCTVTHEADRKSRKMAARAARANPHAVVAVTGCAATYSAEQFQAAAPNAIVVPNARKFELPERILEALRARDASAREWDAEYLRMRADSPVEPAFSSTRERAVVKIQDGCNHACSYCIIPTVRGASTCKSREAILHEVRGAVREGAREVVLTGVSMGDWGRERGRSRNAALCDLLRVAASVEGLARLRTSSLDPADVDDEWLACVASTPRLCPHIHLALQSGSAGTLRRMRRRYTPEMFVRWAKRWREVRPDGGLTTDVIVGFPGETDEEWRETLEVVRECGFSHVHAFPFSARRGTPAAELPNPVAPPVQKARMEELARESARSAANFAARFVGQTVEVLAEGSSRDGVVEGLSPSYVKCRGVLGGASTCGPRVGELARVEVLEAVGGELRGRVLP